MSSCTVTAGSDVDKTLGGVRALRFLEASRVGWAMGDLVDEEERKAARLVR